MPEEREPRENEQQADLPTLLVHKPADLSIEGKPSWMMRDPGPRIDTPDDDLGKEQ